MKTNMLPILLVVLLFSGSIAFASTYLSSTTSIAVNDTDTGPGTDPDDTGTDIESKRYWKNSGATICTYYVWVPKPGGGMELVSKTGIEDPCERTRVSSTCTAVECGPASTDTGS